MRAEYSGLPTPCYLVDEGKIVQNLELLADVARRTGCRILLAQKAFSMYSLYPLIGEYLSGTAASGLYEARLGREEFGGECHVFSPAYREEEFDEILSLCDHVIFNSFSQWRRFGPRALEKGVSCGMRVNPECSTQSHAIYDPCAPGSRLGATRANFLEDEIEGLDGLHFHTLCEQNVDALIKTLRAFEENFGRFLPSMKWLNLGGGHHITREDYGVETLVKELLRLKKTYGVEVYLELGEAVALNAGVLVSTVLETLHNGIDIAILDASAACHMPDVLEMPYRPEILGAALPGVKNHTYRLAGPTCLAGDVVGDYSFDHELVPGDKVILCDMAHYTMVKNNTFNGMALPTIAIKGRDGRNRIVREFGYRDFKERL